MAISSPRLRALGLIAAVFAAGFIVLQFIGPKITNPPVVADLQAPAEVKEVLQTSCYNCHSNETHLWWYDKIAPASWLVARDVKRGRLHMNFSSFGQLSPAQQKGMLYESVNQMQLGFMPPANYLFVHPEAKVTPAQLDTLKKYLHPSDTLTPATPLAIAATDAQRQKWSDRGAFPATNVPPTANGLAFFPDYANWKPVSTTERYDNGTFRIILGNDITQRAIAMGRVQPWPDGAAFAKIAYKQQPDASGNIWAGEFIQVEFMVKDAEKYKSTEGWGFGRWRGDDHKPYGKNANFTTECTSCHRPMEPNDFVYTMPLHDPGTPSDAFNATAALPASLPHDPLQWRVITTSVGADGTMSTLYGNDAAVDHARKSPQTPYPPNSILARVTWARQEDRHWFGGRIPGTVQKVEFVTISVPYEGFSGQSYEVYTGPSLQKAPGLDAVAQQPYINAITSLKAAAMP
jgi:hypothetical protein